MRQSIYKLTESLQNHWKAFAELVSNGSNQPKPRRSPDRSLVKNRPKSLEQRYQLIESERVVNDTFLRVKRQLYAACEILHLENRGAPAMFKESGRLGHGRPYFYIKPAGKAGYLFEQSERGWIVSRAEKIVQKDLFLREGPVLDHVTLYVAGDRPESPRINSDFIGTDLIAISVYEQQIMEAMGMGLICELLSKRRVSVPKKFVL